MSKTFMLSIAIKGRGLEGIEALDFCKSHNIEATNNFFIQGSNDLIFDEEEVKNDELLKEIFKDKNFDSIIIKLLKSEINFFDDECVEYKTKEKYPNSYKLGYKTKDKHKFWNKIKELIYNIDYLTLDYKKFNYGHKYRDIYNSRVFIFGSRLKDVFSDNFKNEIVNNKGREFLGIINKGDSFGISEKLFYIDNFNNKVYVENKDTFDILTGKRLGWIINSESVENIKIIDDIIKKIEKSKIDNEDIQSIIECKYLTRIRLNK